MKKLFFYLFIIVTTISNAYYEKEKEIMYLKTRIINYKPRCIHDIMRMRGYRGAYYDCRHRGYSRDNFMYMRDNDFEIMLENVNDEVLMELIKDYNLSDEDRNYINTRKDYEQIRNDLIKLKKY
ncbi:MAG: hypothetical protein ACRCX8_20530 [Sarcina sp.]